MLSSFILIGIFIYYNQHLILKMETRLCIADIRKNTACWFSKLFYNYVCENQTLATSCKFKDLSRNLLYSVLSMPLGIQFWAKPGWTSGCQVVPTSIEWYIVACAGTAPIWYQYHVKTGGGSFFGLPNIGLHQYHAGTVEMDLGTKILNLDTK